ncbi:hypothetical protein [Ancrocorticia populi]|uniref:hypothetical protein n=1 Tax=Ancrocorticia populi TaxID=2175228 RepID=UPI0014040045|nr:hypothetical protein [Ancrocorticia populi]
MKSILYGIWIVLWTLIQIIAVIIWWALRVLFTIVIGLLQLTLTIMTFGMINWARNG